MCLNESDDNGQANHDGDADDNEWNGHYNDYGDEDDNDDGV